MCNLSKIAALALSVCIVSCTQLPPHPGPQSDLDQNEISSMAVSSGVMRPDASTIILPNEDMTFRKVAPKADGSNAAGVFMLETEVTNEMYARYLKATRQDKGDHALVQAVEERSENTRWTSASAMYDFENETLLWSGTRPPRGRKKFPVAFLTIGDAKRFCEWLSSRYPEVGRFRLPTVEEWVWAAYGDSRGYPWGDEIDLRIPRVSMSKNALRVSPAQVKTHARDRTPEGIYDLGGNVAEFVLDLKDFPSDTRWMGASFKSYPLETDGHPFKPRNDYWGYWHNADSRVEDTGFRVLLESFK